MFIPRELGIHFCQKCQTQIIDDSFQHCGIYLSGDYKWHIYFVYTCPSCQHEGNHIFEPQKDADAWPGDLFRDFAQALDQKYAKDIKMQPQTVEEFLQDRQ